MRLLHAGVDTTVIALWLGHEQVETTQIYLHADLDHQGTGPRPHHTARHEPGRYQPPDPLLAFLEASDYADLPAEPLSTSGTR